MTDLAVVRKLNDLEQRLRNLERMELGTSGTFTPVLLGTGTAGTFTYSAQLGTYTQIGDRVCIDIRIGISAVAVAATGNLRISGLPFVASANLPGANSGMGYRNAALSAAAVVVVVAGQSYLELYDSSGANISATLISTATILAFTCWYRL